jgi:uncharacterized membrane protein (DUF485 family)
MHAPREPDPSIFAEPPEEPSHDVNGRTAQRNARYGLWLFAVYVVLYGGFIVVAAFRHDWLKRTAPGGVNVAIAYGIALIGVALVLALVYMRLCRGPVAGGRRAAP